MVSGVSEGRMWMEGGEEGDTGWEGLGLEVSLA